MFYILTHELVQQLLLDDEVFVVGWETSTVFDTFGLHMMSCEGHKARRQKRPHRAAFLPASIRQNLEPAVRDISHRLIVGFGNAKTVELRSAFAARLPVLVMLNLFGLPNSSEQLFRSWYDSFESALANEHFDPAIRKQGQTAVGAFHEPMQSAIAAAHSLPPGPTLLSALVHDAHKDRLNDEEISRNALIVMFGGISTVEALILNTLWLLAKNPHHMPAAKADNAALAAAIEETIRLRGPVQSATRLVTRDTIVNKVELRQGDIINLILSAANHDPTVFQNPEEFIPGRPNIARHLGFAAGPHLCLGMHLARTEAAIAINALFQQFPRCNVDLDATAQPSGSVFHQPEYLTLNLE